ncbi:MAG: matrixin family metalloprotease [Candidatus Obscuribacterales bacterium]|nr:matrixin family metalloprotease [Candidatus Obscuribacterales bacterium]
MESRLIRNTVCGLTLLSCLAGQLATAVAAAPAARKPAATASKPLPPQPALNAYVNTVHERLMHAWHTAKSPHTYSTVRFRVYRTGQVYWVELTDASKTESVNNAAEDAITSCTFPPMPASFPDYLDFSADFESELQTQNCDGYSRPVASNHMLSLKLLEQSNKLSKSNEHEKALSELLRASQISPFDVRIKDALVREYLSLAEKQAPEEASNRLHQALMLDPTNKTARELLNKVLKAKGKDPVNPAQRAAIAREYAAAGEFENAIVEFGEAWLLSKDTNLIPEINHVLAQNKESATLKKWQAAVESNGSAENHLNLAGAFKACGLDERARVEFEIAKKLGAEPPTTEKSASNETVEAPKLASTTVPTPTAADESDEDGADDRTARQAFPTQPAEANAADIKQTPSVESKTLALTAAPMPSMAPLIPSAGPAQFQGDFPYATQGKRSLKLTVLKNRQQLQDYLNEACKGSIIRWASNRIPLTLYIDPGNDVPGYRPQFRKYMLEAFDAWQKASGGRIRYKLVGGPKGANIVCHWTANPADKRMSGGNEQGITRFEYMYLDGQRKKDGGGLARSAEITILVTGRFTKRVLSDADMKGVCIHELGHSFGIHGHSPRKTDIMYPYMNGMSALSGPDANTIVRLYQGYEHPRD